jgi:hypothetical protein
MNASALLLRVAFIVLLDDAATDTIPAKWKETAAAASSSAAGALALSTWLGEYSHRSLYASEANPTLGIVAGCWDATCAASPTASTCRLEAALACAAAAYAPHPEVEWFVFTVRNVFWHAEGLAVELARAEALLAPATPARDALLIGGGGLLTFKEFLILSRPAVRLLADRTLMAACKAELDACDPAGRSGCKWKADTQRAAAKAANELVHFCMRGPLNAGRCGPRGVGCEWMFGRLVHGGAGDGAQKARARFVSNAAHKHPDTAVATLLGAKTSGATSLEADPCILADAILGLVAYSNTNTEGMKWLASLRNRARLCHRQGVNVLRVVL